ncbi:MAG: HEAT repeat domain-containing protein, partial [Novipirellula sp. JB048]
MTRSCTDGRYVYLRHFYPERPYLKHVDYMFQTPTTRVWKQRFDEGRLNEAQAKFWRPKPVEELFDLEHDPDEVENLAGDAAHAERVSRMREAVHRWMVETGDLGLFPEAELHRMVADAPSPRDFALAHPERIERVAQTALAATDVHSGMTRDKAIELASDEDAAIRFWAIRGIALRHAAHPATTTPAAVDVLQRAMHDASPSVAIAACEAIQIIGAPAASRAASR